MSNYQCHIHIDKDLLHSESKQEDPIIGIQQEAGWMEAISLESVEADDEGYVCVISVDTVALMEAATCDTVEAAIDQEFAWLHDSGIYLDALVPITVPC